MGTQRTVTINKSNWSGETGTIILDEDAKTLKVYNYLFQVRPMVATPEEAEVLGHEIYGYQAVSADGSWMPDNVLARTYTDGPVEFEQVCKSLARVLFNTI